MRLSKLFTKTRREAPRDEVSKNAQLLIRAGFIYKEMAGAYVYLPLGLRVLNKVMQVIREEMDAIGGQEILMTSLQNKEVWESAGRWSDEVVDDWFKTKLRNEVEVGLAFTHEEPLTKLMREYISSYRDLPAYPYQFQNKFRNEMRAKSGIMRGREFIMKDMYSFSRSSEDHDKFYELAKRAYVRIFDRLGIGDKTYLTFASGGSFSKFSHEFQTVTDAGEDTVYIDKDKKMAVNEEVMSDEVVKDLGLDKAKLEKTKAIEVGNIFTLGTKYTDAMDLAFTDEDGSAKKPFMGSYGIGPGRVMGTIAELLSDEKGLAWPAAIAPAQVHLVQLGDDEGVVRAADKLYAELLDKGTEVLFDDRDESAGAKFADADLMGVPVRVTLSKKTLAEGSAELKRRTEKESKLVKLEKIREAI